MQRKKLIDFGPRNGDFYPKNHFLTYEGIKKRREEERNSVTKEEQHDTWREFKKGIERKRV